LQHLLAGFRFFSGERMVQRFNNIFAQNCIGFDKKFFYRFGYALGIYPPQSASGFSFRVHKILFPYIVIPAKAGIQNLFQRKEKSNY
jgi:hypothetical protein